MPTSSRCGNYRNCMVLVVRTVCRFAARVDIGIDPYNHKCNCPLSTFLAGWNEQAQGRLEFIIEQMKSAEGVTEHMKQQNQKASSYKEYKKLLEPICRNGEKYKAVMRVRIQRFTASNFSARS